MKKEPDYIVGAINKIFSLKTDVYEEKEENENKNKIALISLMFVLGLIISVVIYLVTYNTGLGVIGIISIAIILAIPITISIVCFSNNKNEDSYNWKIEVRNNKVYIEKNGKKFEIEFNRLISIDNERVSTGYYSEGTEDYTGYKWYLIIKYLSEENNLITIKLPYKRQYFSFLTIVDERCDDVYINEENEIEKLKKIFITKKQYEENMKIDESIDKYIKIRNNDEEEKFEENLIRAIKKDQIYRKGDLYVLLLLIPVIMVVISIIMRQGGK